MLFVFFFKQKTAYEMRISDWSSDVVLFRSRRPDWPPSSGRALRPRRWRRARPSRRASSGSRVRGTSGRRPVHGPGAIRSAGRPTRDRKNDVSGKSVSVRGDTGGPRINTKNTNTTSKIARLTHTAQYNN